MAEEKIYNRHCFVKPEGDKRAYCSHCGKMVLQDHYNMKKHAENCGFDMDDFSEIFNENSDFAYAVRDYPDRLCVFIFTPEMQLRPAFKDRYISGKWKVIYRCAFFKEKKEIRESGAEDLAYWMKKMERMHHLNDKMPDRIICKGFQLPDIISFQMFAEIYQGKGYHHREDVSAPAEQCSGSVSCSTCSPLWKDVPHAGGEGLFLFRRCNSAEKADDHKDELSAGGRAAGAV